MYIHIISCILCKKLSTSLYFILMLQLYIYNIYIFPIHIYIELFLVQLTLTWIVSHCVGCIVVCQRCAQLVRECLASACCWIVGIHHNDLCHIQAIITHCTVHKSRYRIIHASIQHGSPGTFKHRFRSLLKDSYYTFIINPIKHKPLRKRPSIDFNIIVFQVLIIQSRINSNSSNRIIKNCKS